jgi:hypothetical protein
VSLFSPFFPFRETTMVNLWCTRRTASPPLNGFVAGLLNLATNHFIRRQLHLCIRGGVPFLPTADSDSGPPRSATPAGATPTCAGRRPGVPFPRSDWFWDSHCDSTHGPSAMDMDKNTRLGVSPLDRPSPPC